MRFFVLRDGQCMAQILQCCHHHNSNPRTVGQNPYKSNENSKKIQREFKVVSSSSRVSSLASCLAARETETQLCLPRRQNNCYLLRPQDSLCLEGESQPLCRPSGTLPQGRGHIGSLPGMTSPLLLLGGKLLRDGLHHLQLLRVGEVSRSRRIAQDV